MARVIACRNPTCEQQDETTSYRGEQTGPSKVGTFDDLFTNTSVSKHARLCCPWRKVVLHFGNYSDIYLGKNDPEPGRSGKSSKYTPKVMFLSAIARLRFDDHSQCVFDGNIGFWPFIEMVEAKRNSRNRPDGTLKPKSVSFNRDVYRNFITEKLIPG